MAREKGRQPSSRSAKPAKATSAGPEDIPTSGNENVLDLRPRQMSASKGSQGNRQRDRSEKSILSHREAGVQSSTSTTLGPSNLLWITTDRPADFKNADIQREISKHVMHNFQQKDQAVRESSKARRNKSSQSSQSDEEFSGASATSKMPIDNKSERPQNIAPSLNSSAANANQASSLFREMYYPLSVDLDSLEFQERLGQLISRYLRVWFRDQASRLSGVSDCEEWEQWLPTILRTETLLYAQAFAAVNHINFINPNAYKPERYVLKGHAIQKIKEKLKDVDAAASDGNLGAVLCMASAAHLENLGATNYSMHMLGLQKLVAMRGGLQAMVLIPLLHESLCVCDLVGTIIFRTDLALLSNDDLSENNLSLLNADCARGRLDSPLYLKEGLSGSPRYSNLSTAIVKILNALYELTTTFQKTDPRVSLENSASGRRFASLGLHLESAVSRNDPIYEACRIAGLIYFRALYHNTPFSSPENTVCMQDLRKSLQTTITEGWSGVPGALIWALLVGTAAERSDADGVFLAGHLSTTCISLVPFGHDIAQLLKKFLLLERLVEEKVFRFSGTGA